MSSHNRDRSTNPIEFEAKTAPRDEGQTINFDIVEGAKRISEFAEPWDDLFSRAVDAPAFLSRPWISAFVEEGQTSGVPSFILGWCGPKLVALLPLTVRKCLKARIATPISENEGFYLGLLVDPRYRWAIQRFAELLISRRVFDVYYCSCLSSQDWATNDLLHELSKRGYFCRTVFRNLCPQAKLDSSFDEYFKRIASSKSRQNLLRRERRLFESADVKVEHYAGDQVTRDVLARVAAIEQRSWLRRRGVSMLHKPFFQKLLLKMAHAQFGSVWFITLDGNDAAFEYVLVTHGKLQFGWRAFDLKYESSVSVGQILMMQVVRHACEKGILSIDIGHGEARYKRFWTESNHRVYRVVAGRGFAGRVIAMLWYVVLRLARIGWIHVSYRRLRRASRRLKGD